MNKPDLMTARQMEHARYLADGPVFKAAAEAMRARKNARRLAIRDDRRAA